MIRSSSGACISQLQKMQVGGVVQAGNIYSGGSLPWVYQGLEVSGGSAVGLCLWWHVSHSRLGEEQDNCLWATCTCPSLELGNVSSHTSWFSYTEQGANRWSSICGCFALWISDLHQREDAIHWCLHHPDYNREITYVSMNIHSLLLSYFKDYNSADCTK